MELDCQFSQARQDKARLLWWPNEYITTGNSILAEILTGTFWLALLNEFVELATQNH